MVRPGAFCSGQPAISRAINTLLKLCRAIFSGVPAGRGGNFGFPRIPSCPGYPVCFQRVPGIAVGGILAAHSIAWDLGNDGRLLRVTPAAVQEQIAAAFSELSDPRFAAALNSFQDAMNSYDDRPQRDRDTCKNVMDALEAVAKEVCGMPTATFGNVLAELRKSQAMAAETISVLQKLYDMANNHFRHGMTTPFALKKAEVDFVLVTCLAGILLFVRL